MAKAKNDEQTKAQDEKYAKNQIMFSKKYSANRDLLQVLLEEGKTYTLSEVDEIIKEFKERMV